jgi:hypothetical protein
VKKAKYCNERASDALQFVSKKKLLKENNSSLILDSDMFPFTQFNTLDNLLHTPIREVPQVRSKGFKKNVEYFGMKSLNLIYPNCRTLILSHSIVEKCMELEFTPADSRLYGST